MESETYLALKAIEARDPDGGEREPTEAAYLYHEKWSIYHYGQEVWDLYLKDGWRERYRPE